MCSGRILWNEIEMYISVSHRPRQSRVLTRGSAMRILLVWPPLCSPARAYCPVRRPTQTPRAHAEGRSARRLRFDLLHTSILPAVVGSRECTGGGTIGETIRQRANISASIDLYRQNASTLARNRSLSEH